MKKNIQDKSLELKNLKHCLQWYILEGMYRTEILSFAENSQGPVEEFHFCDCKESEAIKPILENITNI